MGDDLTWYERERGQQSESDGEVLVETRVRMLILHNAIVSNLALYANSLTSTSELLNQDL